MNKIIKWWKRRNFDLRQACIDKYSKEFGQKICTRNWRNV